MRVLARSLAAWLLAPGQEHCDSLYRTEAVGSSRLGGGGLNRTLCAVLLQRAPTIRVENQSYLQGGSSVRSRRFALIFTFGTKAYDSCIY